jgi:hypothetical protein
MWGALFKKWECGSNSNSNSLFFLILKSGSCLLDSVSACFVAQIILKIKKKKNVRNEIF